MWFVALPPDALAALSCLPAAEVMTRSLPEDDNVKSVLVIATSARMRPLTVA